MENSANLVPQSLLLETATKLGRVSLVPRGEYNPEEQYKMLDIVRYGGSSYLVLRPVQGVTPIDGQDYMLVAERGGTGEQGPAGATGPQGPQGEKGDTGDEGPTGPKGDMGPAGPKGDTGETGPQGAKGDQGDAGVGIQNITRTSGTGAAGTTDTYTITMTDGSTSTFQVYNGADGTGAGDMTKSVYDPQGKNTDIFAYADNGLSTKQNTLTGQPGQVVGFNAEGEAVPQDAPDTGVTTFNGRTGTVTPQSGDYTADDILMSDGTTSVSAALSQKADAGVPEQISLPIPEGWGKHSGAQSFWYRKSPNGLVTLYVDIYRSDDITGVQDLGTLPEGFRPEVKITFIGIAENTAIPISVSVYTTGQIATLPVRANGNPATGTPFRHVLGTVSFYAAD